VCNANETAPKQTAAAAAAAAAAACCQLTQDASRVECSSSEASSCDGCRKQCCANDQGSHYAKAGLAHCNTVDGDHEEERHKHLPAKGVGQVDTALRARQQEGQGVLVACADCDW
jgi:hypothetical protein